MILNKFNEFFINFQQSVYYKRIKIIVYLWYLKYEYEI